MNDTLMARAAALMAGCVTAVLASIDEGGRPRPCVLSLIKTQGASKAYFATGLDGNKSRQFAANPAAGACFYSGGDSVTLTGNVKVLTEKAIKQDNWQDWFINHFEGGPDDPNYCVLEFTADSGTVYIDGEFEVGKL